MTKGKDISEWERLKAGRLDEHEGNLLQLAGGKSRPQPAMYLRVRMANRARRSAPANDYVVHIPAFKTLPERMRKSLKVAPFHFAHTFVSRQKTFTLPKSVGSGKRVAIHPQRRDVANLKEVNGATRDSRHRVWTLPASHPFLATEKGRQMQSSFAALSRSLQRNKSSSFGTDSIAAKFQTYIERSDQDEKTRRNSVEVDENGEISFGNLGATASDRESFWNDLAKFERRSDARLQCRIIGELPHWISAAERRKILEAFCEIFAEKRLPFWAVCHTPDVEIGSDPRNFHCHLVYSDRPFLLSPGKENRLCSTKDRSAQGEDWIRILKKRMADAVNSQLLETALRTGKRPDRLFFEGTYKDLGIEASPLHHRGPKETALFRAGILSKTEKKNVRILEEDDDSRVDRLWDTLEKIGHAAIEILEAHDKSVREKPAIAKFDHHKSIVADQGRLQAAIDSASNTLIQLYDSRLAKHCPLSHPYAENALRQAKGRELQNNKDFSAAETFLEKHLRNLRTQNDDENYSRLVKIVTQEEGVSEIESVIEMRRLLDLDRQNLDRRLNAAALEAQNALGSIKMRVKLITRLASRAAEPAKSPEVPNRPIAPNPSTDRHIGQNLSTQPRPNRPTFVPWARGQQLAHDSHGLPIKAPVTDVYSKSALARQAPSPPVPSPSAPNPQPNPEQAIQKRAAEAPKNPIQRAAIAAPQTSQSKGILDLLVSRANNDRARRSGHER